WTRGTGLTGEEIWRNRLSFESELPVGDGATLGVEWKLGETRRSRDDWARSLLFGEFGRWEQN
ncbi:MAG: hypothetical protein GWO02_06170, partial [Gammaproteobacteria bacterium]|nr:hypothetical protein [Gammaproteobacteria bacterium]